MNTALLLLSHLFALVSGLTIWLHNTVPFYCDKGFTYEECVQLRTAAQEIQSHTCIDFLEKPFGRQPYWIHVFRGAGCYTEYLGQHLGNNYLSLGSRCFNKNTITHELVHALGLGHMHQRGDRDKHITVNVDWVPSGYEDQYNLSTDPYDKTIPYDYSSVLHYDSYDNEIIPKNSDYRQYLGNARGASFYDYHTVNRLYNCYKNCSKESFKKCKNGGIPNPRDCSKCNCPSGYIGDFCDKKPPTVMATQSWQKVRMTSPSLPAYSFQRKENTLWIEAPHKNKVEIRINRMGMGSGEELYQNCDYYGLEIKSNKDQRQGGPVVCSSRLTDKEHIYRSHSNLLPLIAYNGLKGQQYYEVEYRYV